jgi:hypothetical protein
MGRMTNRFFATFGLPLKPKNTKRTQGAREVVWWGRRFRLPLSEIQQKLRNEPKATNPGVPQATKADLIDLRNLPASFVAEASRVKEEPGFGRRPRSRSRPSGRYFSNVASYIAAAHPCPLPLPERRRARMPHRSPDSRDIRGLGARQNYETNPRPSDRSTESSKRV